MQCPKAAIFDLDETLAVSFQAPAPAVLERLAALQRRMPVAIMSGAGFDRIERDVIAHLPEVSSNLVLFPNSSSQCYMNTNDEWREVYSHLLSSEERTTIKDALKRALTELDELKDVQAYGEQIVDREAQIAFTAVGTEAPADIKASWDPNAEKRLHIARVLKERIPEFDILLGGASTIDFTRKDTNKSYGVKWFADYLKTTPQEMLYVGDALYPGGNDEVVIPTGIQTRDVANPKDTPAILDEILAACSVA